MYCFTVNLSIFMNMVWVLIQLIKEGRISKAVAKTLIILLRKKGVKIPKELQHDVTSK
jgi:Asp-tRNA(Asn)/Glu-tRNA(Gln) amidotransferase B subunit